MTATIKRPHTAHSFRRSGSAGPELAWGEETSLQNSLEFADLRTREQETDSFKMEKLILQQPTEQFADVSPRNGLDFTATPHGKCKGVKSHGNDLKNPEYFYLTSHRRDFTGHPGLPASNARPQSSRFYPSSSKFIRSSYQEDFGGMEGSNAVASRTGTASGNRRNNPHPLQAFMIWRFPGRLPPLEPAHELSKEAIEHVSRESLKSTYQVDYLGIPQGAQLKETITNVYPQMKSDRPQYTLDSTSRFQYQKPQLHDSLKNNTSRYGCNTWRHVPAMGAVPNISLRTPAIQRSGTTIYSDEFINKSENAKVSQHMRPTVANRLNQDLLSRRQIEKDNSF